MATTAGRQPQWCVEVFFDGACPLCRREIRWLRWLDRHRRIVFTDIAAADFQPAAYGRSQEEFMGEIQGRMADGRWLTGVDVFRQLYVAVGLRPLVWVTQWPGISYLLEGGYRWFARNRLRWTGRCTESCRLRAEPKSGDNGAGRRRSGRATRV